MFEFESKIENQRDRILDTSCQCFDTFGQAEVLCVFPELDWGNASPSFKCTIERALFREAGSEGNLSNTTVRIS